MKSPNLFLKIAALSSFILLMSIFVAYRAGVFEKSTGEIAPAPFMEDKTAIAANNIPVNNLPVDSPPVFQPDSITILMMSSKSGAIFDRKSFEQDTLKQLQNQKSIKGKTVPDTSKKQSKRAMMGGSKSYYIYDPKDFEKPETDTTNKP